MTHNTSSFTVCNTVRDFWAETVAYVEHLILKIGHYTVEQSLLTDKHKDTTEFPFRGRYRCLPRTSTSHPPNAYKEDAYLDVVAVPTEMFLMINITNTQNPDDPIAWSLPVSRRLDKHATHHDQIETAFAQNVLNRLLDNEAKKSSSNVISREPLYEDASFQSSNAKAISPRHRAALTNPPPPYPRSDVDPLQIYPPRTHVPPPFFPDGNLIGPGHPGFGPRTPFGQRPRFFPQHFDPFDPVSRGGDPDPDHAPVPGNSGHGFPSPFL